MMTKEYETELVIARLDTMPEDALLSFDMCAQPLNKHQLIEHVKKQDEIGKKIVEMQMLYLRSFS